MTPREMLREEADKKNQRLFLKEQCVRLEYNCHDNMTANPLCNEIDRLRAEGLTIPEDIRAFIYFVTLHLQSSRGKTPDQNDAMFQRAYRLYVKYDVEGSKQEEGLCPSRAE